MRVFLRAARGLMILSGLSGLAAFGCASQETALRDRVKLIGQPLHEFVQCAGAPTREFTRGSLTVLTYSQTARALTAGGAAAQQCDVSVSFENERAVNVTYLTMEESGLRACEPIIRACSGRSIR